jgi:hypothetical protein
MVQSLVRGLNVHTFRGLIVDKNRCPFAELVLHLHDWLLLDSRVVDVSMASNPTFVFLSSLEPLFFNSPENELRFSDNTGA